MNQIEPSDSLVLLDNLSMILSDLNKELSYRIGDNSEYPINEKWLFISSDGDTHAVHFLGNSIWSSSQEKQMGPMTPRQELEQNERRNFEKYLRTQINDRLKLFQNIQI